MVRLTPETCADGGRSRIAAAIAVAILACIIAVTIVPSGAAIASQNSGNAPSEAKQQLTLSTQATTYKSGNYKYKVDSKGNATITKYVGSKNVKTLKIPKKLGGHKVTIIGKEAFMGLSNITSITIPKGVTRVKDSAFSGCWNVTKLSLPSTLKRVDGMAFYSCQVKNLVLPASLKVIGGQAFAYTQCVTLPKNAKSFKWTTYASGDGTCTLQKIKIAKGNKYLSYKGGVLYNKSKSRLIYYLVSNDRSSFAVPNSVKKIDAGAFSWSFSLKSVTLGKKVQEIGDNAFAGAMTGSTFVIPATMKKIGAYGIGQDTTTVEVKSRKLTASNVKDCLKGHSSYYGTMVIFRINVGTDEENQAYVEKYRDIFTAENTGCSTSVYVTAY